MRWRIFTPDITTNAGLTMPGTTNIGSAASKGRLAVAMGLQKEIPNTGCITDTRSHTGVESITVATAVAVAKASLSEATTG